MLPSSSTPSPIYLPLVHRPGPQVVLAAAHIDSARTGEPDEALLLQNRGPVPAPLAGWILEANGRRATFPDDAPVLAPREGLWCAREARAFQESFGFWPGCTWGEGPLAEKPLVVLEGRELRLTNAGGTIHLWSRDGRLQDTLFYGARALVPPGWHGPAAQLYARGSIPVSGQIWRRKPDLTTGQPVDTDTAQDWAGDLADVARGRRAFFPGWGMWQGRMLPSASVTARGTLTVAVGPEALYPVLAPLLAGAQERIWLSLYTLEHPELAQILAERARAGVPVQVLLEGGPAGGITDMQRWSVAHLLAAGVQVRYLDVREDAPGGYRARYRYLHAKYGLVDRDRVWVGTENPSWESMPVPDGEGRWPAGRRGVLLALAGAGSLAADLGQVFVHDWDAARFADVRQATLPGDGPPSGFVLPERPTPWRPATPFQEPLVLQGDIRVRLLVYPDANALAQDPLLALVARAGPGDRIRWLQLYEHRHWGPALSDPVADPNPRVWALWAAARRGAQVRILLDRFFDDPDHPRSNRATADFLNRRAQAQGADLQVRLANPTGLGLHAKMALLALGQERWIAVGSLNGGEVSHKLNREVVLLVESPAAYAYLESLFEQDWQGP